jgi:hypothetical protein
MSAGVVVGVSAMTVITEFAAAIACRRSIAGSRSCGRWRVPIRYRNGHMNCGINSAAQIARLQSEAAMSESVSLVPVEPDEEIEERVLKLRMQGFTAQQIARKEMISVPEVHRALDAILPTLDHNYRGRIISESLLICDRVISKHLESIADPESASVVIRGLCERRFWIGVNASTDPVRLSMDSRPEKSTAAYQRAINHVLGRRQTGRPEVVEGEQERDRRPPSKLVENLRRLAAEKPSGSSGSDDTDPHK